MPNSFWMGRPRPTKFKLGTQTEHEDPYQRQAPWPPSSKVKVARSRDASDRCWPICRERNVLEIFKLVGRLPTPRQQCLISRSKAKVTWSITLQNNTSFRTTIAFYLHSLGGDTDNSNMAWVRTLWVHSSCTSVYNIKCVLHFVGSRKNQWLTYFSLSHCI